MRDKELATSMREQIARQMDLVDVLLSLVVFGVSGLVSRQRPKIFG